jgi:hypothetical protein
MSSVTFSVFAPELDPLLELELESLEPQADKATTTATATSAAVNLRAWCMTLLGCDVKRLV